MKTTLARSEVKSFEKPEEVRTFEKGRLEIVTISGRVIGRARFEPGWKWSECVGPTAGTSRCEAAHLGYQMSGTMRIVSAEGEYDIHAGEAFSIPPGHDAWVVGDEPVVVVDSLGMAEYAKPAAKPRGSGRKH